MHPTTTTPRRAPDARLLVTVVGVLLGLLGMHALTAPGAGHDPAPAASHAAPAGAHDRTHDDRHAAHAHAASTVDESTGASASGAPVKDEGGHGSHSPGSMLMMCLAVLAVAVTLLWPRLRSRATGFLRLPRLTGTRLVPARPLGLGTGPPPAWQFSVIRC